MRKILLFVLCSGLLLLSSCSADDAYKKYEAAYRQLEQADSFATEYMDEYYYRSEPDEISANGEASGAEEVNGVTHASYQACRSGGEYQAIGHLREEIADSGAAPTVICNDQYICDGCRYDSATDENGSYKARAACEPDLAFRLAVIGTMQFPKDIVKEQSTEATPEGELLTFVLDEEKCFAYLSPTAPLTAFSEAPVYTALLDSEGRLKEVTGSFCLVGESEDGAVLKQLYAVSFTQYGGLELDFSALDRDDYLDLNSL